MVAMMLMVFTAAAVVMPVRAGCAAVVIGGASAGIWA
jgi:hypothetical protein